MDARERVRTTSTTTATQRQALSRLGVNLRLLDERDERGDLTVQARVLRNIAGTIERMYLTLDCGGGSRPAEGDGPEDNSLSRELNFIVSRVLRGKLLGREK